MKKISIILTTVAICLISVACSSSNNASDAHVFYYTYSDTYISNVRSSLGKAFDKAEISYHDYDSNGNQTTQTEQVQTAITQGAKVLAVNIVNTGSDDAAQGIISQAKNANVPVIFFNREVSDDIVNSYDKCIFIGTDAEEAGHLQGEMIGQYVIDNFDKVDLNKDGKISYILFKGEEGNNEAIYRTKYSVEDANKLLKDSGLGELVFYDKTNPNKYLVDKNGQWSAAAANEYMTTALTSYNEANNNMIELVICNNDGMAEGAITALNSAGFNTGDERAIPVFGVDATDAAIELINNGKMAGTVKQDAEGMANAISIVASNALSGNDFFDGTDMYHKDDSVAKLRIPYSKYFGE